MSKRGVHRVIPGSESGRRMIRVGVDYDPAKVSPEVRAWNAAIEAKKKSKLLAKIGELPK